MFNDFEHFADQATYMIGELMIRFTTEVESLHQDDIERIKFATLLGHQLQEACEESIKILNTLEESLSVFKEPVPIVKGGDFEADVLRDLANLDSPRHRPVSHKEVKSWCKDWINTQEWA